MSSQVSKLKDQYLKGQISRRQFLRYAALLGVSLPTASALIAGCTPATAVPPTAAPAAAAATAAPAAAGRPLRIAGNEAGGESNVLDPATIVSGETELVDNQIYERLGTPDKNFQMHPQLATAWEPNADLTQWTFHLRKDVKFNNGAPMTAKDVVWSYQRLIDPKVASEAAGVLSFLTTSGIAAVDDYTVKFTLKGPVAEAPLLLCNHNAKIVPDKSTRDSLATTGIGTGPYMTVNFKPVEQPHHLVKNPYYWDKTLPRQETLEIYVIQEETSRLSALQSGQVDIAQVSATMLPALQKDSNITVVQTGAAGYYTLSMWCDTPPFDKVEVRKAMKMCVDRQAILTTALNGVGEIGDDNPIPPASPQAWRSAPAARDVAGAKALLASVGYTASNPLKVDLYSMEGDFAKIAQVYKQQAADAGIQVNVILSPSAEYWDNVWLKQPFCNSVWNIRDASEALSLVYRKNSLENETHFFVDAFDALLDKANTEPDAAKRLALYKQAEQMLTETGGTIGAVFAHALWGIRKSCNGFDPYPMLSKDEFFTTVCS